jgi:large subunit ribosomal protein L32
MHLVRCPQCGTLRKPHHVCPDCGTYKGESVLDIETAKKS